MNDQVNKKYIDLKNYSSKNLKINFSYESLDISKLEALAYIFTLSGYKIIDDCVNFDCIQQPKLAIFTIRLCIGFIPSILVILGLFVMKKWEKRFIPN